MKNITITSKHIKREIIILLIAFVVAIGLNIYSIINYNTQWKEIYSQIGYVIAVAILLYLIFAFIRGLIFVFVRIKKE